MGTNGTTEKDPTFKNQNDLVLNVPSTRPNHNVVIWMRSYGGIIEYIFLLPSEPAALAGERVELNRQRTTG